MIRILLGALTCAWLSLLLSCGGAGGVGSSGTGFAGTQIGAVTGFGSVIVEGNTYGDSALTYLLSKNPGSQVSVSADKLRIGMQVELSYTGSSGAEQAQVLIIKPTVIGSIESLAADSLVVAGQRVRLLGTSAQGTVFENFARFSSLAVGNAIEVHGTRNALDEIIATRIELLSASAAGETRIQGRIAAVQTLAGGVLRLSIGALAVDVTSSTSLSQVSTVTGSSSPLSASALAVGQRVSLYAATTSSAGVLSASSLQVENAPADNSAALRIGGVIRELSSPTRFSIGKVEVDAASATFSGGVAADLAVGRNLRVLGTISSSSGSAVLKASDIRFLNNSDDLKIEVSGAIGDFAGAGSFRVRNTVIDASASTVEFSGGTATQLNNDVLVKVEGSLAGNVLKAARVSFQDAGGSSSSSSSSSSSGSASSSGGSAQGSYRAWVGTVSGYQAATGTFTVQGINAHLQATTQYKTSSGGTASIASMANGVSLTIRGTQVGALFEVSEVEFEEATQPRQVKLKGVAYEVDLVARTLKLNATAVQWNGSTQIEGSVSNLNQGYQVEIEGLLNGSLVTAQKMKISKP